MELTKDTMLEIAELVATSVVKALKAEHLIGTANASKKGEKTAYQKTEQLLYNYKGFLRIVDERRQEIEDIKRYGVPKKGGAIVQYGGGSGTVQGIVLPEESVESAIHRIEGSVQDTVRAIGLIDKCMAAIKSDPYYKVLEMRYFEGRTLEDIAVTLGCDHSTVSRNKNRLVKEVAMRLFPDDVMSEYMK